MHPSPHPTTTPAPDPVLPAPSTADRQIPAASKGHFTGHLVCGPGAGRVVQVESHLEMQIALVLLGRVDTEMLEEQVAFGWTDARGRRKTHAFDFRLTRADGHVTAIAVKPTKFLRKNGFLDKMRLIAAQVTPDFADAVRVMTERDLDPVELHNAELFHGMRHPDPEADAAAAAAIAPLIGAVPLAELADRIGLGARGFRALVRRIAAGELCARARERITPRTLVRRTETLQ
jgi:hypothetical protein